MRLLKKLMSPKLTFKPQLSRPNAIPRKWNIVRGDSVEVVNGPCTGERGKVLTVIRKSARVIVENVNVKRRKLPASPATGQPGKVVERPVSIHYSNVNLVCPVTDKPTRVARKFLEDGSPVRVAKISGAVIPRPEELKLRKKERREEVGPKETGEGEVWRVTYDGTN